MKATIPTVFLWTTPVVPQPGPIVAVILVALGAARALNFILAVRFEGFEGVQVTDLIWDGACDHCVRQV